MKPKKVLVLLTELNDPAFKGGIQVFNQFLVAALQDLRINYSTVILNDGGRMESNIFVKLYSQFSFACRVLLAVSRYAPDMIINGHVGFSLICFLIKMLFGIPYITITYGIDVWDLTRMKKIGLANSRHILAISNYTRSFIASQLEGYPQDHILLLPNAVDSERFKPSIKSDVLMRKFRIKVTDSVILSVSRLSKSEKDKGYGKIITVVKDLLGRFPNVKYILGGSGDDLPRLHALVAEEKLEEIVYLPGFIPEDELPDYYNLCDLFVLPSKKEGFGFVFLEALACGKPVIAGNKDGSVDAVLNGELGLLVDPDNVEEIKNAIVRVLTKNIPKNMLNNDYLRARVLQEYGFDSFKNRLEKILS